jgi:hypothetical protein
MVLLEGNICERNARQAIASCSALKLAALYLRV